MTLLESASQLIASFEGLKLNPYLDQGGIPTIGYGSTQYEDGTKVTINDPNITQDRAMQLLELFVQKSIDVVHYVVKISLSDNQVIALTSFQYNTGHLLGSTLLKLLNKGDFHGAADQFLVWCHVNGKINQGLFFRRSKEQALFLEGVS